MAMTVHPQEQIEELTRSVIDLHTKEELAERLVESFQAQRPLRIKMGFDPTAPDLHFGHTVGITRLRRFQEFGHTVIFLIGDATAMIGDPTGKNATRPPLSQDQVRANAETYKAQVFKILDPDRTEVRFNSEWLGKMKFEDFIRLSASYTVARIIERRDFKERMASGGDISMHEFLYPLMQGYDSVALDADVELGGSDQLFNLLVGRTLMKRYGKRQQIVMTLPLLEGLDAKLDPATGKIAGDKMSKSLGNYVGVTEAPEEQFGKLMSVSDDVMWRYYELLSALDAAELTARRRKVEVGELHPKAAKVTLAKELVARFHGAEAANRAEAHFEQVHARKEVPDDVEERAVTLAGAAGVSLVKLLAEAGVTESNSDARRLISQGGVSVNGARIADPKVELAAGDHLVKVGKRRFVRFKVA
jgi:tyrosyl-tRNA synthetase